MPLPSHDLPPRRDPEWTRLLRAADAHAAALMRRPGVCGIGVAFRRRGDAWTAEPCVAVYVARKRGGAELRRDGWEPLPRTLGRGVPVDVVEAGRVRRRLSCGARIGWRGVGTGDGWGTLGVVARERAGGRPVAITAMHLTGLAGYPPGSPLVFHAADGPGAAPVRLGLLLMGTLDGVDAAKVSIDPPLTVDPFLPGIGRPRGCRPVSAADLRAPVQMYGARSRYRAGLIVGVATDFPADGLRGAFLVEMRCGNGDSGAVCCGLDGAALGLYVGSLAADAGIQVFCPMDAVLEALDCELAVDGG